MKNFFVYWFLAFLLVLGILISTASILWVRNLFQNNRVTPTQWSQTLKTLERNSKGPNTCDVKWEDKKMVVTFHFNNITNSFFRD